MAVAFVSEMCYFRYMNTNRSAAVSTMTYHFVFCPRYRRKVFLIDGLRDRFTALTVQICAQNDIDLIDLECGQDYCRMLVHAPPRLGPADVMRLVKRGTGAILRQEFLPGKCPQLWTRDYFVSGADEIPPDVLEQYLKTLPKRGHSREIPSQSP